MRPRHDLQRHVVDLRIDGDAIEWPDRVRPRRKRLEEIDGEVRVVLRERQVHEHEHERVEEDRHALRQFYACAPRQRHARGIHRAHIEPRRIEHGGG
jgi:hypothetical protein